MGFGLGCIGLGCRLYLKLTNILHSNFLQLELLEFQLILQSHH